MRRDRHGNRRWRDDGAGAFVGTWSAKQSVDCDHVTPLPRRAKQINLGHAAHARTAAR